MIKRRRKKSGSFYLKNENLLKYIHESKKTFCEFEHPNYSDYDLILHDEEITQDLIQEGKSKRAERLNDELGSRMFHNENLTNKQVEEYIEKNGWTENNFKDSDVVFRRMTDEHVPTEKNKNGGTKNVKVKFPPFKHVILDNNREKIVGWSHTKNGKWSQNHGRITDSLGRSFIELTEQFGKKKNWRGYSWLQEMKDQAIVRLSEVALQFDESKSSNPFSYYTMIVDRTFIHVLQNEKKQLEIKKSLLDKNPELGNYRTHNEQADIEIKNYEQDHNISKSNDKIITSGRSLSQIKKIRENQELENQKNIEDQEE